MFGTYTLMIEMLNLLTEDEILEQSRTTLTSTQAVLIFNRASNVRGHERILVIEIELREELFGIRGSISTVTTFKTGHFPRHVRTGRIGHADETREELQRMHC
jgi:hypothetical protein